MVTLEDVKKAIQILHKKEFCEQFRKQGWYIDFSSKGRKFTENKSNVRWSEIFHGRALWCPSRSPADNSDNWKGIFWHWKDIGGTLSDIDFQNFCKYFEIEYEMGLDKPVYLSDEDDFIV